MLVSVSVALATELFAHVFCSLSTSAAAADVAVADVAAVGSRQCLTWTRIVSVRAVDA